MKIRHTIGTMIGASLLMLATVVPAPLAAQGGDAGEPKVTLKSDKFGPRQIEDLTSRSVPRDYALAWQSLVKALDSNRAQLLDAYFTGFAKDDFTHRIAGQKKAGIHVKYTDHGHKLEALFYSPAGDAMQLRDRAQLEMQVLEGDKVLDRQDVHIDYMVLMTPGADRWLVRDLQSLPEEKRQ
jgi:hypothetical protein